MSDSSKVPKHVAAFREVWEHIVRPALETVNEFIDEDEPPSHLLHFTDIKGFLGIIGSKQPYLFRATSCDDLNEIAHGVNLAHAEVLRRTESHLRLFKSEILMSFVGRMGDGSEGAQFDPHICCLTVESNVRQAEHWKTYGNNGTGFALRFRSEGLIDGPTDRLVKAKGSLAKVMYKLSAQEERTFELVDLAIRTCREARNYSQRYAQRNYLKTTQAMGRIIVAHAAIMKRAKFQAENEWRLVNLGIPSKRDGEMNGRTYYEYLFDPDDLETVVIGPAQDPAYALEVERLLRQHGFAKTNVEVAKIELKEAS